MVVRLGLNSVSVLDFPTQGLAASSLEERLCWTRLRMGVGMTDEELGSEWNIKCWVVDQCGISDKVAAFRELTVWFGR